MVNEYVENIMRNGITHFAEELQVPTNEVQIMILWSQEEERPKYKKLCANGLNEPISFNQILNVKFDLMNREYICANFIGKTLEKFSKELACPMSELFVLISLEDVVEDGEQLDAVKLYLYHKSKLVQPILLEELLA
jgi:hypothetical protein